MVDELGNIFLGKLESANASLGALQAPAEDISLEDYLSGVEDFELALAGHLLLDGLSNLYRLLQRYRFLASIEFFDSHLLHLLLRVEMVLRKKRGLVNDLVIVTAFSLDKESYRIGNL